VNWSGGADDERRREKETSNLYPAASIEVRAGLNSSVSHIQDDGRQQSRRSIVRFCR
jgi:hypothetical protein